MSNLPNPPQPPNTQDRRNDVASKAEPERSLVAIQQRLGALLVCILRLVGDVCCNDGDETYADGLADLVDRLATLVLLLRNSKKGMHT